MAWCLCYSQNRVIVDKEFHKEFHFCKTTSIIGELVPAPETSPSVMKMLGVCHAKIYICCELYMNNRLSRLYWNKHHMNTYHNICYVFSLDIQKCLYRELHLKKSIHIRKYTMLLFDVLCISQSHEIFTPIIKKQDMLPNDVENPSFSVGIGALASHPRHVLVFVNFKAQNRSTSKARPAAQRSRMYPWNGLNISQLFTLDLLLKLSQVKEIQPKYESQETVDNSGICNVKSRAKLLFWWQVIGSLLLVPCRVKNCI